MKIKGQKAVIEFNDAEGGIHSDDKPVETLEICDASGVFHPARAIIDDKDGSLIVWNDAVRKPVAVRYMFSNGGIGNLKDTSGLPVAPFRTDSPFIVADRAAADLAQEMALTDIEISGYDYKRGKLKKGDKLFLNRNYPINIVPERFREFDMLIREATPGELTQPCSVIPKTDGMLYVIARKNERTLEDLYGWREVKDSEITYSPPKGMFRSKYFAKKPKQEKRWNFPEPRIFAESYR